MGKHFTTETVDLPEGVKGVYMTGEQWVRLCNDTTSSVFNDGRHAALLYAERNPEIKKKYLIWFLRRSIAILERNAGEFQAALQKAELEYLERFCLLEPNPTCRKCGAELIKTWSTRPARHCPKGHVQLYPCANPPCTRSVAIRPGDKGRPRL